MPILPDILDEMNRLIESARESSILMRAIGGLAIRVQSGVMQMFYSREYRDMDFVVADADRKKIEPFFLEMGYESNRRFNLLNGSNRQIYLDRNSERHVDVFVGNFEMCLCHGDERSCKQESLLQQPNLKERKQNGSNKKNEGGVNRINHSSFHPSE